jgi:hypothetical protein
LNYYGHLIRTVRRHNELKQAMKGSGSTVDVADGLISRDLFNQAFHRFAASLRSSLKILM